MENLQTITCKKNCQGIRGCHFGVKGELLGSENILFVLNNTDQRILQKSLFGKEFEETLFRTKTGKIIYEILEYCRLDKDQITITNLFKGILPVKKEAKITECKNCLEILLQQIKILSPQKIIIFGRHGKKLLSGSNYDFIDRCYFSDHPSYIWAKTISPENRKSSYEKIMDFLQTD